MKDLWERWKRFYNGQDRIDRMKQWDEQRMEWHREDIERARKQARAKLRDEFAKAALMGLLSEGVDNISHARELYAEEAYLFADAMLKVRGQ